MTLPALLCLDALLIIGASLRLVRLFMVDDLGARLVTEPLYARLLARLPSSRAWLAEGLWCPYCLGFWLGAVVLGSWALATLPGAYGGPAVAWRYVAAVLALNWLVGAITARVDITGGEDDEG